MVSDLFDTTAWRDVPGFDFDDITYHRAVDHGTVRIAFNRPEVRNAFRPRTVDQLYTALDHARMTTDVGCVLLTGNGPSPKDGGWAFCSGGDQEARQREEHVHAEEAAPEMPAVEEQHREDGETTHAVQRAPPGEARSLPRRRRIGRVHRASRP